MERDFVAEWLDADAEAEALEAEDTPVGSDIDMEGDPDG